MLWGATPHTRLFCPCRCAQRMVGLSAAKFMAHAEQCTELKVSHRWCVIGCTWYQSDMSLLV